MDESQDKTNGVSSKNTGCFDDIIAYSSSMTKILFGSQISTYPDGLSIPDKRAAKRRESIRKIKAKDQFGDLVEKLVKPSHFLARPRSNLHETSNDTVRQNASSMIAPELSIVLRDTNKTVAQTRIESVAKSARALIAPWMNSIDQKSRALDEIIRPEWHAPWKLYRVISSPSDGGWIQSLAVDPSNMWFASGCGAGLIRIYDIASGSRRITLTGHISGVRGLCVSDRHPYLFSCGEDKKVICWDLEQNQAIRNFHGHLSGVYSLAMHPTENLLVSGGRDSVARVWDMRTKEQIHCFTGHAGTVGAIECQETDPQIITGSYDTTIRLWDLKAGKTTTTLTNHKKSVRALTTKHDKTAFASGAADNIKQWSLSEGKFFQNLSGHNSIINCMASNKDDVLVSGADNGTLFFWDWRTGYNFQQLTSPVQPGSIESEAGLLALTFDRSGARLIAGKSDKTIRMFREDLTANEESHPIDWKPDIGKLSRF